MESKPEYILLDDLPPGHELRTQPLLDAECRTLTGNQWREITNDWRISVVSFEQLGPAWTRTSEFRVRKK